jgi:hypothetical protein
MYVKKGIPPLDNELDECDMSFVAPVLINKVDIDGE